MGHGRRSHYSIRLHGGDGGDFHFGVDTSDAPTLVSWLLQAVRLGNPPAKLFRNFLETEIESLKRISRVFERNGAFFSRYRARVREPRCSRSGRFGRGRPLRIRPGTLPLSSLASRACLKAVGAMYARGAGPSTPSLDQRERVGHYREQAVPSPRLHSRRWYQRGIRSIIDMRPVSTLAIVFVHQHSLRCSARVAAHASRRFPTIR